MKEKSPPQKLSRSRSDRYIGGVAAGIANRFNVDPLFVRLAFAFSLILGGLGVLAYAVLLAVMPIEGDPSDPLPPIEPRRRNMMIGLVVMTGIFAVVAADSGQFASWAFGFWPGTVFGVLFWCAAGAVAVWLLATRWLGRESADQPADTSAPTTPPPPESPSEPEPSTEVVTYAESPSQLSTEVMETRQMETDAEVVEDDPVASTSASGDGSTGRVRDDGPSTVGKIMLWFAIGLAALTAFSILFVISAGATAIFGGVPMAVLVILFGGGMIFAGVRGRRQLSLWLLTAAVAVTLPMAAVSIADLRVEGSYGDIHKAPVTRSDIPADGYRMAAGATIIDLRKYRFDQEARYYNDPQLDLRVSSGMGLTSVIVPDDICVTGSITGKAGVVNIRGSQSNGLDVTESGQSLGKVPHPDRSALRVKLDGQFKLGAFEVVDNTLWRQGGQGGSFGENDLEPDDQASIRARERATAACTGPDIRTIDKADARAKSKSSAETGIRP